MKPQIIGIILVSTLVAGGAGFFAGSKYQQNKARASGNRLFFAANVPGGRGQVNGMRTNFRPVTGDIISVDDKSITVKMQDGSTKIVLFSDKTAINKAETGSSSDLTVNTKVAVFGQENTDGSVTAQNIQINPTVRIGVGEGGNTQAPPAK